MESDETWQLEKPLKRIFTVGLPAEGRAFQDHPTPSKSDEEWRRATSTYVARSQLAKAPNPTAN